MVAVVAGLWLICGREGLEAGDWLIFGVTVGFSSALVGMDDVAGVENAPVESFWRRSNSSCSLGGRRGGEGPVANAGLETEEVKVRVLRRASCGRRRKMVCGAMVSVAFRAWY